MAKPKLEPGQHNIDSRVIGDKRPDGSYRIQWDVCLYDGRMIHKNTTRRGVTKNELREIAREMAEDLLKTSGEKGKWEKSSFVSKFIRSESIPAIEGDPDLDASEARRYSDEMEILAGMLEGYVIADAFKYKVLSPALGRIAEAHGISVAEHILEISKDWLGRLLYEEDVFDINIMMAINPRIGLRPGKTQEETPEPQKFDEIAASKPLENGNESEPDSAEASSEPEFGQIVETTEPGLVENEGRTAPDLTDDEAAEEGAAASDEASNESHAPSNVASADASEASDGAPSESDVSLNGASMDAHTASGGDDIHINKSDIPTNAASMDASAASSEGGTHINSGVETTGLKVESSDEYRGDSDDEVSEVDVLEAVMDPEFDAEETPEPAEVEVVVDAVSDADSVADGQHAEDVEPSADIEPSAVVELVVDAEPAAAQTESAPVVEGVLMEGDLMRALDYIISQHPDDQRWLNVDGSNLDESQLIQRRSEVLDFSLLQASTGLRLGECRALRVEDVSVRDGVVYLDVPTKDSKSGKREVAIQISTTANRIMNRAQEAGKKQKYLFPSPADRKQQWEKADCKSSIESFLRDEMAAELNIETLRSASSSIWKKSLSVLQQQM